MAENCKVDDCRQRELRWEIERLEERIADLQAQWGYTESIQTLEIEQLRTALIEIHELCMREPANPFLADKMDRVAIAALSMGKSDD